MEVKEMIRILRTHPGKFPFYSRVADKLEELNSQCTKLLRENGKLRAELQEYKDALDKADDLAVSFMENGPYEDANSAALEFARAITVLRPEATK